MTIIGITKGEAVASGGKKGVDGKGVGSVIAKVRAEPSTTVMKAGSTEFACTATDAAGA